MSASPAAFALLLLSLGLPFTQTASTLQADPPMVCASCDEWNAPREPFRVFGNTYFVGPAGVSSVLITSDDGHILLDGGLSQSAPVIDANIRKLGFRTEDIRLIAASHEHYDHVGGIAALQRLTGAPVVMSRIGIGALAQGAPTAEDPQIGFGLEVNAFPVVSNLRAVTDGEVVRVGALEVTAHLTPGHTPGAVSWSWRSCEGSRCASIVYADSLGPISAPGFRFLDDPARVPAYRRSLETIASLPCDIILAVHPVAVSLDARLARRADNPDALWDSNGCRAYAAGLSRRLEARVAEESR